MRILVYEWAVGGGLLGEPVTASASLRREGAAMLVAVLSDFARLPGVQAETLVAGEGGWDGLDVVVHRVASLPERDRRFNQLAAEADGTIVIAPEAEGTLLALSQRVLAVGGRLLSVDPAAVGLASDKHETIDRLHCAGLPVPRGGVVLPGERTPEGFFYPAVLKPIDGAGSVGVQLLKEPAPVPSASLAYRLEEFKPGQPASVAVLCGPNGHLTLEPCLQRLAAGGDFAYLGGALPLEVSQRERARRLAGRAVAALGVSQGYVGVDLVLGAANDGSEDAVIEVNPRYTTSYVGLRAATDTNLAEATLALLDGQTPLPPKFERAVEWDAAGNVTVG